MMFHTEKVFFTSTHMQSTKGSFLMGFVMEKANILILTAQYILAISKITKLRDLESMKIHKKVFLTKVNGNLISLMERALLDMQMDNNMTGK